MSAELFWVRSGRDAANDVQPILLRKINQSSGAVDEWLVRDRNKELGWARKPVAKKRRRRNSHYCKRLSVERKRCSHHRWISAELLLPRPIADHRHRRRAFAIVVRHQNAPRVWPNAKH